MKTSLPTIKECAKDNPIAEFFLEKIADKECKPKDIFTAKHHGKFGGGGKDKKKGGGGGKFKAFFKKTWKSWKSKFQ